MLVLTIQLKNFPTDTQFAQVGIVKNPTSFGSTTNYVSNDYSSTGQIKVVNPTGTLVVGDSIKQVVGTTTRLLDMSHLLMKKQM